MNFTRRNALMGTAILPTVAIASKGWTQAIIGKAIPFGKVPAWFEREPLRISWHLLRDIDGGQSGADLVAQAADAKVNAICFTVGGSRAFYPTDVPFHQRSSTLSQGRDLVGEITEAANAKGLRTIARFDFSRQPEETWKAHPEWFIKRRDGSYGTTHGRYRPCLTGGFYREVAPKIVEEAVSRYRPSMLFINNFVNILWPSEEFPCVCTSCQLAWAKRNPGTAIPEEVTSDYRAFLEAEYQVTASIIEFPIRRRYPDIVILNADAEPSDGLHTESRIVLPGAQAWPYETAEAVDRQRMSRPDKFCLNICISYSSQASRAVLMPPEETRVRMYQTIASGSHPVYGMTGTYDQYDRDALAAAKEVFDWHRRNEDLYVGQRNAARTLLLNRPSTRNRARVPSARQAERGIFQILAENHIPVASAETDAPLMLDPARYDLVVVSRGAPLDAVGRYVRAGGAALYLDQHPGFAVPAPLGNLQPEDTCAYWRVHPRPDLPELPSVDLMLAGGGALDDTKPALDLYPPERDSILTLVPPMIEDPAEQAMSNIRETEYPGVICRQVGKGRLAFLPWNIGGLYNQSPLHAHSAFLMAIMRMLREGARKDIETDAAPAIHIVWNEQTERRRNVLHLTNLSGQTPRGFEDPVRTGPIRIAVRGEFRSVESRALSARLPVRADGSHSAFTLPSLDVFDSLILSA